ncbi:tyrosine-protein phosphatase [Acidimangrovimonas sediminis]|uniref:tyrosine-protein phosphatase n=1 Tax=Acidimangrovimonas sediminis TaxID=2056283 RepID=UPI0011AF3962|nr:sulfur transferase domain-containing protein [Acidimangrovimonas sediminis]
MFKALGRRLKALEHRIADADYTRIEDPRVRRRAMAWLLFLDHGILRGVWTNFFPVAEGVYRSNQPDGKRVLRYGRMGIKAILNLRGDGRKPFHLFEKAAAREAGIEIVDLQLQARDLVTAERLMELDEVFRTIPRPFVMHCKSGADRAGFASALYLLLYEGATVEEAQKQLSLRYAHVERSRTGILDHFLRYYGREQRRTGIGLREWIRDGYDPEEVRRSFADWREGRWDPV